MSGIVEHYLGTILQFVIDLLILLKTLPLHFTIGLNTTVTDMALFQSSKPPNDKALMGGTTCIIIIRQ